MPSVIAKLVNIRTDTYLSYEKGVNEPPEYILEYISMMYKISKDVLLSNDSNDCTVFLKNIDHIRGAEKEEKIKLLVQNITDNKKEKLNYREINLIKNHLKNK